MSQYFSTGKILLHIYENFSSCITKIHEVLTHNLIISMKFMSQYFRTKQIKYVEQIPGSDRRTH